MLFVECGVLRRTTSTAEVRESALDLQLTSNPNPDRARHSAVESAAVATAVVSSVDSPAVNGVDLDAKMPCPQNTKHSVSSQFLKR